MCVVPWKTHQVVVPPVVHFELSTAISFAYHFQGLSERDRKNLHVFFFLTHFLASELVLHAIFFFRNQRSKYTSLQ